VTEEAYKTLVHYCLSKRKSLRGITKEASQLLIEAISQKLGARESMRIVKVSTRRGSAAEPPSLPRLKAFSHSPASRSPQPLAAATASALTGDPVGSGFTRLAPAGGSSAGGRKAPRGSAYYPP